MRYGLSAQGNGTNFSLKESSWYFTDFCRTWYFSDFCRAFHGLFKGILQTFFGHFTDFSVDCMTFNKTKNFSV
jgi:hypothetical protein